MNDGLRKSMRWIYRVIAVLLIGFMGAGLVPLGTVKANGDKPDSKVVRVGYYENENFQEGAGEGLRKTGYSYEYLQKVASITGWKYEYVYGSWSDIYNAFVAGDIDILAGLGYSESRLGVMYYPDYPMGYESYYLYVRVDDTDISAADTSSLNGKKIGTITGLLDTAIREWIETHDVDAEVVVFSDVHERDQALEDGEIDAFIGEGASVSAKSMNKPLFKIKNVDMYLCVTKSRKDLIKELNGALAELDTDDTYYLNELSEKYFNDNAINTMITDIERKWLEEHDYTLTVGYTDNFLPYCGTGADGKAEGVMVDALETGFRNLKTDKPVKIEYVVFDSTDEMIKAVHNHEIEILFPISDDIYYLEEQELYHSKNVIVSAMYFVYLDNMEEAQTMPLAINKNNQIQYNYAECYLPELEVKYYDSVDDCLTAVVKGEAGGAILSGLRANILLSRRGYTKLKYAELPYNTVKCFGISTHHKGILSLVNKALNSLDAPTALNYSYRYMDDNADIRFKAQFRRYFTIICAILGITLAIVIAGLAVIRVKQQKEKMYFRYAYIDDLTKLLNRRSYEEELHKLGKTMPDNLICVSMDLNGLKRVNDNLGHAAGDELIREAAALVAQSFGKYGKVFRTGGDEYCGLLKASAKSFEEAKKNLDAACDNWKGTYEESKMKISVGAAYKSEIDTTDIMDICKMADKRMYEAKSEYYRANNIDRRAR